MLSLFAFDIFHEVFGLSVRGLPPLLSMEPALLLASVKTIRMIHRQSQVDHLQFRVLNSIEFQINLISKRLKELETRIEARLDSKRGAPGESGFRPVERGSNP